MTWSRVMLPLCLTRGYSPDQNNRNNYNNQKKHTVLILLSVSRRFVQFTNNEGRSTGDNFDLLHQQNKTQRNTVAWRLTTVNLTVILRPFQSMVAFWISSPTFLGAYKLKPNQEGELPYQEDRPWEQEQRGKQIHHRQHGDKLNNC